MQTVSIKMSDTEQKDENHNVITPMIIIIPRLFAYFVFHFIFCVVMIAKCWWHCIECADCNLNVKPSEYYDYFCCCFFSFLWKVNKSASSQIARDNMSFGNENICFLFHSLNINFSVLYFSCWKPYFFLVFLFNNFLFFFHIFSS